jgi:DNA-binding Xre family transcriptional regulator
MLDMRLRLPELMKPRGIKTAYQLAQVSKGRINQTTALRLMNNPARVDMRTLDALCDTLGCKPSELFARD